MSRAGIEPALSRCMVRIDTYQIATLISQFKRRPPYICGLAVLPASRHKIQFEFEIRSLKEFINTIRSLKEFINTIRSLKEFFNSIRSLK